MWRATYLKCTGCSCLASRDSTIPVSPITIRIVENDIPLNMERIGKATTLLAMLAHRTSSPTHSLSHMMVGKLSSIYLTDYKATILPMRPVPVWTQAPINIVSNPAASDPTVRNGISCLGCHTEGMKTFEDQVRSVIESNTNPTYDKAQALRLYVEKSEMDTALVTEDMERYRVALDATRW